MASRRRRSSIFPDPIMDDEGSEKSVGEELGGPDKKFSADLTKYIERVNKERLDWRKNYHMLKDTNDNLIKELEEGPCGNFNFRQHLAPDLLQILDKCENVQETLEKGLNEIVEKLDKLKLIKEKIAYLKHWSNTLLEQKHIEFEQLCAKAILSANDDEDNLVFMNNHDLSDYCKMPDDNHEFDDY